MYQHDKYNRILFSFINRLQEKKGYLQRIREESDRRLVCLELTKQGHRLNQFHTDYHKNLVNKIYETLTESEVDSLFDNLQKLNKSISVPITLDQLKIGESATVRELTTNGSLKTRLMEMGIIRGTTLKLLKIAPLGDPLEIQVRGALLSIRKHEASQIQVLTPVEC